MKSLSQFNYVEGGNEMLSPTALHLMRGGKSISLKDSKL